MALARAISVAGLAAASGGLFYARLLRPAALPACMTERLRRLCFWSLAAAIAASLLWLGAQTQDLAGDSSPANFWIVLAHTRFGYLLAMRLALLIVAMIAWRLRAGTLATLVACITMLLQAGHSHAEAMGGSSILLVSSALHLLAAGIWLGGLPALWIVVSGSGIQIAHNAASRFSHAGIACVMILLATSIFQFSILVVGLSGLVGTAYGWMVCMKSMLFAVLVALAARNKLRLTPALLRADPHSRQHLVRAIAAECAIGMAVLAAAGVLTELEPSMHMSAANRPLQAREPPAKAAPAMDMTMPMGEKPP